MAIINGTNGADNLNGSNGADTINGFGGNDTIRARGGDDLVYSGDGNDTVTGGTGNDTLYGDAGLDTLSGEAGNDLLYGGNDNDLLYGGSDNDSLYGDASNDTLSGDDGADYLSGGTGNDSLLGGTGDDTLAGGAGADTLSGGEGMDYLDYSGSSAGVTINLATLTASGGDATGDVISGDDGIIGSAHDDSLTGFDNQGTSGDVYTNVFYAGAGNDTLDGAGGDDLLYGEDGNDSILGGAGADLLDGGAGNDTIWGGDGADTMSGGDGSNALYGDAGADSITGGSSADTIDGGADNDTIRGGSGDDSILGGTGNDSLYGEAGADTIDGGDGNDLIDGGTEADSLSGGTGVDTITGGSGGDTLSGGAGADVISGGDDADTIYVSVAGDGYGDAVDGGEGGLDADILDLTGSAPVGGSLQVTITSSDTNGNGSNGYVTYFDSLGNTVGTLSFSNIETVVPCFTPGTQIITIDGPAAVEDIRPGDRVLTRDNGFQTVRWIGARHVTAAELAASPRLAPVRIAAGALGGGLPERALEVSPQHRMLIAGADTELMFGESEVLAAAVHLVGQPGITRARRAEVDYIHIMFDRHEIISAEGAWTESFQPGDMSLRGIDADQRSELFHLFPELQDAETAALAYPAARVSLRAFEVRALMAA